MDIKEMKHILQRIGDPLTEEEIEQFFQLLDNGSGHISMDELVKLLEP
jgi:Ca2+-binding EF-hand superfamily protein